MLGAMVMFRQAHRSKDYDAFFEYFSTMSATTDLQLDWLRAFVTVVDAGSLCQPRAEPEVVFCLSEDIRAGADIERVAITLQAASLGPFR